MTSVPLSVELEIHVHQQLNVLQQIINRFVNVLQEQPEHQLKIVFRLVVEAMGNVHQINPVKMVDVLIRSVCRSM